MPSVEITIPVPADVAEELLAANALQWAGEQLAQIVSDRKQAADRICGMMEDLAAHARAAGLTPEILEEELAAYKASRSRR